MTGDCICYTVLSTTLVSVVLTYPSITNVYELHV